MIIRTVLTVLLLAIVLTAVFVVAGNPSLNGLLLPIIIVSAAVVFILLLLFGKAFCGFFCPIGLLNDIVWRITLALHLPKLSRSEKFMKIINILQKVFFAFFVCGITSLTVIAVFFPEILSGIHIPLYVIGIAAFFMIVIASFARRLFCNICPIGTFIGLFRKLNIIRLKKDSAACTMCGACYEACPMRIKSVYTEQEKSDISTSQCLYCGECIKKCPEDGALSLTLCGKKIYGSSREDFVKNQFSDVSLKKDKETI